MFASIAVVAVSTTVSLTGYSDYLISMSYFGHLIDVTPA